MVKKARILFLCLLFRPWGTILPLLASAMRKSALLFQNLYVGILCHAVKNDKQDVCQHALFGLANMKTGSIDGLSIYPLRVNCHRHIQKSVRGKVSATAAWTFALTKFSL